MKPEFQHSRFCLKSCVAAVLVAASLSGLASAADAAQDEEADAASFPQVENKVKKLKKRVKQLEADVAALQATHYPVEVAVDCAAGNSIGAALADHAEGKGLLTVRVSGLCAEAVVIDRSHVLLVGASGATVQAPAGNTFVVSVVSNVRDVTLADLTITGTNTGITAGILAIKGAHVVARNVVVHTAGSGAMALDNGIVDVTQSVLRNNNNGAYAARGGVVSIDSTVLENNAVGGLAFKAGVIIFTSSGPDYGASTGPIVRNNTIGAIARSGGFLEFADTIVENNGATGILADSGGAVQLFANLRTGGNRITGHTNAGLLINKHASVVVSDLTNVITGNGRGIFCINNPSYLVPAGFTVTGNALGDIVGCTP